MDERFYCVTHKIPVEYIPELDLYTCGRCEATYKKEEVIPARLLEQSIEDMMEIKIEKPTEQTEMRID